MVAPDPSNDFSDSDLQHTPLALADKGEDEDFIVFSECAEATCTEKVNKEPISDKTESTISTTQNANTGDVNNSPKIAKDDASNAAKKLSDESTRKRYVSPQDFELRKVIGMGAFGKVLQVRNKKSKQILAMKIISKRLLNHKSSYVENIHAERDILTKIRHPFIVTMHCSFQTREKLFIIMDFLAGGELFLRLGREGIFLEATAKFYIGEIVLALEHLHSRGVLHRDLKPENILLASDGHLCLTDFGLAKDFRWEDTDPNREDGRALTICGTQEYMAPEMVAKQGYTKAADWWSLGCIAYEMLAGEPPFQSKKGAKDLFRKIMNERVRMPDGSSAGVCKLLKGLLNRDASARLGSAKGTMFQVGGVAQVKELDFFAGLNWTLLEQKEIDPPMTAHVDNDEDLRHFYDEFTKMQLPRSVKEMTDDDFKPKQVKSEFFKGFSFIQHDFPLPDRTEDQDDHYWNNEEHDGESASECASLLDLDNDGTSSRTMKPTLESTPENADMCAKKKKRPPRKKKNRDNTADSTIAPHTTPTAPIISQTPSNAIEVAEKEVDTNEVSTKSIKTAEKVPCIEESTKKSQGAAPPKKIEVPKKLALPMSPKWESVSKAIPKIAPKAPENKKAAQSQNKNQWNTIPQTVNSLQKNSLKANAKTWTPTNFKSSHNPQFSPADSQLPASAQWTKRTPVTASKAPPDTVRPPSDWRDHTLHSNAAPIPQRRQPVISDANAFPSLGDFPSLAEPTNTKPNPTKTPEEKSSNVQGSWAKKSAGPWGNR